MRRRLGALILAAAMGGCTSTNHNPQANTETTVRASGQYLSTPVPGLMGPYGEPVQAVSPYTTSPMMTAKQANYLMSHSVPLNFVTNDQGVVQACAQMPNMPGMPGGMITPPGVPMMPGMPPGGMPMSNGSNNVMVPRSTMGMMSGMNPTPPQVSMPGPGGMPLPPGSMQFTPGGGPFPGGRPPGAVAAIGALTGNEVGPGAGFSIGRTQVRFVGPSGMKVAWLTQAPDGKPVYSAPMVEAPGRYNFLQASIYRLKLTSIEKRPGLEVYPTLEVVPCNHKTQAFLSHSAVPVDFTDEDFQEVADGKYLIKVIYLPDPQFQELAAAGPLEISSTRLEPGADPILEAQRRGSILLVIRMGNIDQEAPNTPPLDNHGPHGAMMPPGMMPPGMVPPGMMAGPGMMPPGMMPPGMVPPGMMAGPGMMPPPGMAPAPGMTPPGPSGATSAPAVPPYLRSGPAQPMPSGPPTPGNGLPPMK
jgi:hypothetical protein